VSAAKGKSRMQSAFEMLITYSWAFLILAVVLSLALVLSGPSAPSQYIPSQCSIQPLLYCQQTLLVSAVSGSQMQFKALIINNLAPFLYFPNNALTVTATNLGSYGTNNYTGSCSPYLSAKGSEMLCVASIPGTLSPPLGSVVSLSFSLNYQICTTGNLSACPTAVYTSTGQSTQSFSLSSTSLYKLNLLSNVNTIITVNNQRFQTGGFVYLPSGIYTTFAAAPLGYAFSMWSTNGLLSVTSTTTQNTIAILNGAGILTANFISETSQPTTIPTTVPSTSTVTTTTTIGPNSNPALSIIPAKIKIGNTANVAAQCYTGDTCDVDFPLGTHLCTGTGQCSNTVLGTVAGNFVYYANDLTNGHTMSGNLMVVTTTSTTTTSTVSTTSSSTTILCGQPSSCSSSSPSGITCPSACSQFNVYAGCSIGGGGGSGHGGPAHGTGYDWECVTPPTAPSGILYALPIVVESGKSSASGPFQVMVEVNSKLYSGYEASNLMNVEFFNGSTGSVYKSWLEGNASNEYQTTNLYQSTDTVYWVVLPSGLAANSNLTIYMGFASTSTNLFGGSTVGEAPQLSPSYGEYDNGASVFNFYANFSGTILNSANWEVSSNPVPTLDISNGLTFIPNGGSSHPTDYLLSTSSSLAGPGIAVDILGYPGKLTPGDCASFTSSGYGVLLSTGAAVPEYGVGYSTAQDNCLYYLYAGGSREDKATSFSPTVTGITTIALTASTANFSYNYSSPISYLSSTSSYPIGIAMQFNHGNAFIQWIRTRSAASQPTTIAGNVISV